MSNRFDDPLEVRNGPKRSFEVIFLNFKRKFHIRAETAIMQQLNINLFYKFYDLNGVLSSHVTRWRCRIISCYENHVINLVLFICEIVVFPILKPFLIKKIRTLPQIFHTKWYKPRDISLPDTLVIFYKWFFCLQEQDYGSKKEILFTSCRFRIFWLASPIFGTASTIERTCLDFCHLVKTKL